MATIEEALDSAAHTADNIHFLCSLTSRRFDCILRAAEALKQTLAEASQ